MIFKKNSVHVKYILQVLLDCGAVQSDALTVDCQGSLEQVPKILNQLNFDSSCLFFVSFGACKNVYPCSFF